jgi:hypothetical protein
MPGDRSSYSIEVEEEGSYKLEIHYHYTGLEAMQFEMMSGEEIYQFEILPGAKTVHFSSLPLSAGNYTFTLINKSVLLNGKISFASLLFTRE